VLVTGPTGSGKTTTLYSTLSELNDIKDKVITTEDPVEYDIEGIIQIPIDTDVGVTFASCLRAILRQDPDIILVGEVRDLETAEIAIQAALTGHLVFSTLHTNDSPATVTRLKDMGIQPFMICATVEAILAQRLVRRICTKCREETKVSTAALEDLGMKPADIAGIKFFKGAGCDACNNTGYKGRIALFELMVMTDQLREMILSNASTDELREEARRNGMLPLREFGVQVAADGVTTLDEIIRETVQD
jgi:type IV pilus assembly protein PilB